MKRSQLFSISFITSLLFFQLYQIFSLPLQITYDGHGYIFLANILGTDSMVSQWDILRTPLYPFLLRLSFMLFGEGALSIKIVNTACYTFGIFLLFKLLCFHLPRSVAFVGIALLALFPVFIVYQHLALTECTTFACMALIMFATANYVKASYHSGYLVMIWLSIVLGFYARPTLVYLSLPVAFVVLMTKITQSGKAKLSVRALLQPSLIVVFSFAAAYPWLAATKASGREATQIAFGMINQALPAAEDEVVATIRPQYEQAIERSLQDGRLGASGIWDPLVYGLAEHLHSKFGKDLDKQFFASVLKNPKRYLQGIKRGLGLLTGGKGIDSDNQTFLSNILATPATAVTIDSGPTNQEPFTQEKFSDSKTISSNLSKPLMIANKWSGPLIRLGCISSLMLLIIGILSWQPLTVLVAIVPLFFIVFHAFILFSLDRMAVPAWPICLTNVLILFWKATCWSRKINIA